MGKRVIIFGVDISSSVHIDNNERDILIHDTMLTAEAKYLINFSKSNKYFFKVCIMMGATVFIC